MATIKSFTDLSQSKVLAEFLPEESADMCWCLAVKGNPEVVLNNGYNKYGDFEVPCWSLAALLRLMPKRYNGDDVYMPLVGRYYEGNHKFICGYFGDGLLDCTFGETSVDACVEMILKLHEQKLL